MEIFEPVQHLAGRLIECKIWDPANVLGRRPRIILKRRDNIDRGTFGSIVMRRTGHGSFFSWLPEDATEILILDDKITSSGHPAEFRVLIRRLSLFKMMALMLARTPCTLCRTLMLALKGNRKGAKTWFLRMLRRLAAPSYQAWVSAQRCATAAASAVGTSSKILITIGEGSSEHVSASLSALALSRVPYEEMSPSDVQKYIESHGRQADVLWMKLPAGAVTEPGAIEMLIQQFKEDPFAGAIYTDEDLLAGDGVSGSPIFKPDWNPPLVQSGWLPVEGAVIRTTYLDPDFNLAKDTADILLAIAERHGPIVRHIPTVALHRAKPYVNSRTVMSEPISSRNMKVSVIIPTRDRADLLKACLEGIFATANGVDLDVIVVDNESKEAETRELLHFYEMKHSVRRIELPGDFNFSRACNLGVEMARHELVLLLNNDTEPLSEDWLLCLVEELQSEEVGAAGALLLYPDGLVQHGGVTLSPQSVAYHTFQFYNPQKNEDHGLLSERRDVSAVTAACLLTRRSLWRAVGGMDEANLPVSFNDVDYCLKLRQRRLRILWTPKAKLLHRESVSRKAHKNAAVVKNFRREEQYMLDRWAGVLDQDPYHNPNFGSYGDEFVLEGFPRSRRRRVGDE